MLLCLTVWPQPPYTPVLPSAVTKLHYNSALWPSQATIKSRKCRKSRLLLGAEPDSPSDGNLQRLHALPFWHLPSYCGEHEIPPSFQTKRNLVLPMVGSSTVLPVVKRHRLRYWHPIPRRADPKATTPLTEGHGWQRCCPPAYRKLAGTKPAVHSW